MENLHNDFYRIVDVNNPPESARECLGWCGVIIGVTDQEEAEVSYAVYFEHIGEVYALPEGAFLRTALFVNKEDIYNGDTIKIVVDEGGAGRIAE